MCARQWGVQGKGGVWVCVCRHAERQRHGKVTAMVGKAAKRETDSPSPSPEKACSGVGEAGTKRAWVCIEGEVHRPPFSFPSPVRGTQNETLSKNNKTAKTGMNRNAYAEGE